MIFFTGDMNSFKIVVRSFFFLDIVLVHQISHARCDRYHPKALDPH